MMVFKKAPIRFKGIRWRREKEIAYDRDHGMCVFCGTYHCPTPAHIVRRSQGGSDLAENIMVACVSCHGEFDRYEIELPTTVWERMSIEHREQYTRTRRSKQ